MNQEADSFQPVSILLVEDNPGDVNLTREALQGAKVHNLLHVVDDVQRPLTFFTTKASTPMRRVRT